MSLRVTWWASLEVAGERQGDSYQAITRIQLAVSCLGEDGSAETGMPGTSDNI